MKTACFFKALQTKNKFRNPNAILNPIESIVFSSIEETKAAQYIEKIEDLGIRYTYPGAKDYPVAFLKMKEPPLFIEYMGEPIWMQQKMISVVGSRKIHSLSKEWILTNLTDFLQISKAPLVSGGAYGVDQFSHWAAIKVNVPSIAILPCGIKELYPNEMKNLSQALLDAGGCLMSEFENHQRVHKSFFYFRNRLIAALGDICLIIQAQQKSGTALTVNHALDSGRPVVVLPAHPCLGDFSGNIKWMQEGAYVVSDSDDLLNFWRAESWSS